MYLQKVKVSKRISISIAESARVHVDGEERQTVAGQHGMEQGNEETFYHIQCSPLERSALCALSTQKYTFKQSFSL